MKPAWSEVTLTMRHWDGERPVAGDTLRTPTGRRYQVTSVKGLAFTCLVLPTDAESSGNVFEFYWLPRNKVNA